MKTHLNYLFLPIFKNKYQRERENICISTDMLEKIRFAPKIEASTIYSM